MGDGSKPLSVLQKEQGHKPAVKSSPDLARILALSRRLPIEPDTVQAEAMIEHVMAKYAKPEADGHCNCARIFADWKVPVKPCIKRLNYAQAWMLHEIKLHQGVVAHAAVGIGKTVVDILGALAMPDCKTAVLLIPPTLAGQLAREWELVAEHFHVPSIVIHYPVQKKKKEWTRIVQGSPCVLHVLPYSRLSRPEATVYLEEVLKPDAIFADECQNLANLHAVRTGRLVRYFEAYGDAIRMGCWSGSLTDDEIQDYVSLSALSLKHKSPVPLDPQVANEWGSAINPDANGWQAPEGALSVLRKPTEELDEAYNRLLRETPGFIITSGASVDIPLEVCERTAPDLPDNPLKDDRAPGMPGLIEPGYWPGVKSGLDWVREMWVRPDGEILVDALAVSRTARELACGLFLQWKFYKGETEEQIKKWKAVRKEWRSEMRDKLKERIPHMDSPMLCATAAMRAWGHKPGKGGVIDTDDQGKDVVMDERPDAPIWKAETWPAWYEIKNTVQPVTTPVRLDPFLAIDAAEWATENRGIVWYQTVAFGRWVAEISGLPQHEGGPRAGERLAKEKGDRSIVASIKSHGTGRDGLQRLFSTQLITQPPASAVGFEQLFGRLSRIGQNADLVTAYVYRHTQEIRAQLEAALRKSLYVQRTIGTPQRLTTSWME